MKHKHVLNVEFAFIATSVISLYAYALVYYITFLA